MNFRSSVRIFLSLGIVASLAPGVSYATNGMNMIGYNTRSSGLAGADVALGEDCPACNPATLGGEGRIILAGGVALLHPPVNFQNGYFGPNDVDSDENIYAAPYLEYAHRLKDSPWTLGLTVRAQGGMGVEYEDVRTFAGNQDELYTNLQIARFMPTASYRVNDQLKLGASLQVGSVKMSSKLFPGTYSPGPDGMAGTMDDFAGMHLKDVGGVGYAGRIGLFYKVSDRLNLGLTYLSETDIDMDGGRLTLNLGIARVAYAAELERFALPQEAEFGLSYKVSPRLRLVADIRWIDWASAADEVTVKGSDPDLPVPLQDPEMTFKLKWKEQWVFALGTEFMLNRNHTFRIGYNYGGNPVPNDYLSPLFPGHVEHHVTLGYGYSWDQLSLDLAWEHSLENKLTNTNPNPAENPFGPDSTVTVNPGNVLHLGLSYRF